MSFQLISIIVLVISVIIHELAHAVIADRFGDPTARSQGRLTINPIPHIDPVGSILIPLILVITGAHFFIGWAKPVPINPGYFKNPSRDMMWVSLAGPLSNITLLATAICLTRLLYPVGSDSMTLSFILNILVITIQVNLVLALFNLIPIPPLDGSKILGHFLPSSVQLAMLKYENYGMILIIAGAYFGVFSPIFRFGFRIIEGLLL